MVAYYIPDVILSTLRIIIRYNHLVRGRDTLSERGAPRLGTTARGVKAFTPQYRQEKWYTINKADPKATITLLNFTRNARRKVHMRLRNSKQVKLMILYQYSQELTSLGFVIVDNPSRFFNFGRVFKTLWTEPAGANTTDTETKFLSTVSYGQQSFTKFRRFVVARQRLHSCLCLPIYTYGGRGASKSSTRSQDNAVVFTAGEIEAKSFPEEMLIKDSFSIILEHPTEKMDPMSRLDFGRVYTVEYNVKVMKIGRVSPGHLKLLDKYFLESVAGPSPFPETQNLSTMSPMSREETIRRTVQMFSNKNSDWQSMTAICDSKADENWITRKVLDSLNLEATADQIIKSLVYAGQSLSSKSNATVTWRDDNSGVASDTSYTAYDTAFYVVDDAPFDVLFGSSPDYTRVSGSHPEVLGERASDRLPLVVDTDSTTRPMPSYYHAQSSSSQDHNLRHIVNTSAGDTESLDRSYRIRNHDYKRFFQVGRVFATLWTEGIGSNAGKFDQTFVSEVIYKERVHSKIRRFVIVKVGDRSCVCSPVTSYSGAGLQHRGIKIEEHGYIYSHNPPKAIDPRLKKPLRVILAKGAPKLADPSFVNYAKVYTVETNVKVKEIGELDPNSKKLLLKYFHTIFIQQDEDSKPSTPRALGPSLDGVGGALYDVHSNVMSQNPNNRYPPTDYSHPGYGGHGYWPATTYGTSTYPAYGGAVFPSTYTNLNSTSYASNATPSDMYSRYPSTAEYASPNPRTSASEPPTSAMGSLSVAPSPFYQALSPPPSTQAVPWPRESQQNLDASRE